MRSVHVEWQADDHFERGGLSNHFSYGIDVAFTCAKSGYGRRKNT